MPLAFSYDAEEAVDLWVTRWSRLWWLRWTLGAAAPSNSLKLILESAADRRWSRLRWLWWTLWSRWWTMLLVAVVDAVVAARWLVVG